MIDAEQQLPLLRPFRRGPRPHDRPTGPAPEPDVPSVLHGSGASERFLVSRTKAFFDYFPAADASRWIHTPHTRILRHTKDVTREESADLSGHARGAKNKFLTAELIRVKRGERARGREARGDKAGEQYPLVISKLNCNY